MIMSAGGAIIMGFRRRIMPAGSWNMLESADK
jgi:hypothetical protein